ncbi:UNVERIFIED_CONTAM: hypothetical protein GTU68_056203 [Idotea baltica]|nr:hypothetical protein [Idotea baltica]
MDKIGGTKAHRPELAKLREHIRSGDTLVVWRLDQLARSLKNLIQWVTELEEQKVAFKSLQESIDTTTPSGKLVFHLFGALAEFERNLIRERTMAGLTAARGKLGGRPGKVDPAMQKKIIGLYNSSELTVKEICEMVGISKPTMYKYIEHGN